MATATLAPPTANLLTWEDYLTEGEINRRYDIIDGVREFMPGATLRHPRVQYWITRLLGDYEIKSGLGIIVGAPFDVLIRRTPRLRTRQPDVLFLRPATLALASAFPDTGVLTVAPELVVEIISNSETARWLNDKLADYCEIGVLEAWVVRPDVQTVEVLALTPNGPVSVAVYNAGQNLQSLTFPNLTPAVADFFLP